MCVCAQRDNRLPPRYRAVCVYVYVCMYVHADNRLPPRYRAVCVYVCMCVCTYVVMELDLVGLFNILVPQLNTGTFPAPYKTHTNTHNTCLSPNKILVYSPPLQKKRTKKQTIHTCPLMKY
jgi:hypothetical protein